VSLTLASGQRTPVGSTDESATQEGNSNLVRAWPINAGQNAGSDPRIVHHYSSANNRLQQLSMEINTSAPKFDLQRTFNNLTGAGWHRKPFKGMTGNSIVG
jgi:hypothetical protein